MPQRMLIDSGDVRQKKAAPAEAERRAPMREPAPPKQAAAKTTTAQPQQQRVPDGQRLMQWLAGPADSAARWFHDTFQSGTKQAPGIFATGPATSGAAVENPYKQKPTDILASHKGNGYLDPGEHTDPRVPGGYSVDKSGQAGTPEQVTETNGRMLDLDSVLAARRDARIERNSSGAEIGQLGQGHELSLKEYKALDPKARSAIDFNTQLNEAINRDLKLDKNGDGEVSLAEAGSAAGQRKGYTAAYERVFGKPAENEMSFAPATVALLDQLKFADDVSEAGDYTRGRGFITDEDLKAKRNLTGNQELNGTGYTDARSQWVTGLTDSMADFKKMLAQHRADINGLKASLNLETATGAQRSNLADTLANGLTEESQGLQLKLSGRDFNNRTSDSGLDVSFLADSGTQNRAQLMNTLYTNLTQGYTDATGQRVAGLADQNQMFDKGWINAVLKSNGLKYDEWKPFAEGKLGGTEEPDSISKLLGGK